jgi:hypothetical protein
MRANVGETEPTLLETTDTELFAVNGYLADIAGRQGDVADLVGYFVPFEFFRAHLRKLFTLFKNCLTYSNLLKAMLPRGRTIGQREPLDEPQAENYRMGHLINRSRE